MSAQSRTIEWTDHHGRRHSGWLEAPPGGATGGWAILAEALEPGAGAGLADTLRRHGLGVLRPDDLPVTDAAGFDSAVAALAAAADALRVQHGAPRVLVGHGALGAAALVAGGEVPDLALLVTLGAPGDPVRVRHRLGDLQDPVQTPDAPGPEVLEAIGRWAPVRRAHRLRPALLVMHAPLDAAVPIEHARRLFDAANYPKGFVSLDGADHGLTEAGAATFAAAMLDAWLARYVHAAEEGQSAQGLAPGTVHVEQTGTGGYTHTVWADGHRLLADEPEALGGADAGPSPYGYLLAGLGACTAITLRIYAQRQGLALERVGVTLRHKRDHGRDCADCDADGAALERIERRIALTGDLTAGERERLQAVADRCPVHRTLTSTLEIETRTHDE